jgi:hypothetical protein
LAGDVNMLSCIDALPIEVRFGCVQGQDQPPAMVSVSAGSNCTCFLTDEGRVLSFSWAWANQGAVQGAPEDCHAHGEAEDGQAVRASSALQCSQLNWTEVGVYQSENAGGAKAVVVSAGGADMGSAALWVTTS